MNTLSPEPVISFLDPETDKEEREEEIDEGLDRAPLSVVDASKVPI